MVATQTQLCSLCVEIDIVALIDRLPAYGARSHTHHSSYANLVDSALKGCELCQLLHASLFKTETSEGPKRASGPIERLKRRDTGMSTTSTSGDSESVISWHEELDKMPSVYALHVVIRAESTLDTDFSVEYVMRYIRSASSGISVEAPKTRKLVLSADQDLGLGIQNRPITPFPSFSLYSRWVKACAHEGKHLRCEESRPTQLPARLIDVGVGADAGLPKLVATSGVVGEYLTLSHCWGTSRPLVTSKANLLSHLQGISFASFPKMFQDALLITKIVGYRYIWIDSLCIIQDDPADWEEECSRMGDIYRNSVCTLAAPASSDSNDGLLAHRDEPELPSCMLLARRGSDVLGHVTVGPPPPEFKEKNNVLSTRAWVLQEQVLSPRTLYFGKKGMYFQCNSHDQLESYHRPLPPERVTPWRTSEAGDLPKTLLPMAMKDVLFWYSIVRQYSFRLLTFGDDKLPALSGLANMISNHWEHDEDSPFGEYYAGLWSNDLEKGLTWTTDSAWDATVHLHKPDESAPSWSWASQNQPIEWKVLREFKSDVKVISCELKYSTTHTFGRVDSGILTLNGAAKACTLHRRDSVRAVIMKGIGDFREMAEVSLDSTTYASLEATWPSSTPSFLCRALMLGKAESSLHGTRWYAMILAPIGQAQYRRLGICNSFSTGSSHARSLSTSQSYNWFDNASRETVVIV